MGLALGKDVTPARNRVDGSAHVCGKIRSKTGVCNGKRTAWPGRPQAEFNLFSLAKPERGSRVERVESRLLPAGRSNRRNPYPEACRARAENQKEKKKCTKQRYKNERVKIRLETSQNSSHKKSSSQESDCIHLY